MFASLSLALCLSATPADDWRTLAERSDYRQTPRYQETMEWFARLDASSDLVQMQSFGNSAQGRELNLVIVASDGEFTPELAQASGKDIVLIQAAIHAGENEGKDTLMALVRDIAIEGRHRRQLDKLVLLLVPIFNVDGHERFSAYNRINQNGPDEMGWRVTAQNLNLNRDFMKADTPEMQAWLALWNRWKPDLLVDMHNTNGADYQYPMTWAWERTPTIHPALAQWQERTFKGRVQPALERAGWKLFPYVSLLDHSDIGKGLSYGASTPRFSVGYAAIANRAGLLLETHMLKDFRTRVAVNTDLLVELMRAIARRPGSLRAAVRQAEADTIARAAGSELVLRADLAEDTREADFLGYESTRTPSEVSGGTWLQYHTNRPVTLRLPVRDRLVVGASASAPSAYVIPAQWRDVIAKLEQHGLVLERLEQPRRVDASTWRFDAVEWTVRPFEGRHMITKLEQRLVTETFDLPAGSVLLRLDQARADIAMHLLEPAAPDSLIRWGHFNAIFEEKEYAEPRVMEAKAREMLSADPRLREEFDARLQDPDFAASPQARLRFFYERSPYFDQTFRRYPVLRLDAEGLGAWSEGR